MENKGTAADLMTQSKLTRVTGVDLEHRFSENWRIRNVFDAVLRTENSLTIFPSIFISIFAGIIVDRANRKYLMMLGDAIAASSTLAILILHLSGNLAIWHLYLAASINGGFGQIQELAYSTSITLLVSPQNYTRANSMNSVVHYGSNIISPAIAGLLYPIIDLGGILLIDLATFGIAIATLIWIRIPQPSGETGRQGVLKDISAGVSFRTPSDNEETGSKRSLGKIELFWGEVTFGIRYIWQRDGLRTLLIITALFLFFHDLAETIGDPMILARSDNNSKVLGAISSAAGIGGVTGAVVLSVLGVEQNGVLMVCWLGLWGLALLRRFLVWVKV